MKILFKHLTNLFVRQRRREGIVSAAMMFGGAFTAVLFQRQHRELLNLEIFEKYIGESRETDVLFHLSHRHYLSNKLSRRERIDCALTHYRHEGERYGARYKDAVYRDGGVLLWNRQTDGVHYCIKLRATTDLRHEGGISVVLLADDACLCEMSFAWVDGTLFGLERGIMMFITRNQSVRHDSPALAGFRRAFPQNSPRYFCLAAVHGVAAQNGSSQIAAIKYDCQVAFETRYASGFRNSYCEFWKSFGGIELDRLAHVIPVPLAAPPVSEIKGNHRKRALNRRALWAKILEDTQRTLADLQHSEPARESAEFKQNFATSTLQFHLPAMMMLTLAA